MLHFCVYAVGCLPGAGNRESRPRGSPSEAVSPPLPRPHSLPSLPAPPCSCVRGGETPPPRPGSRACGREVEASQEFAGSQIDASREGVRSFGWTGGAGSESNPAPDPLCDLGQPLLQPPRGQEAGFYSRGPYRWWRLRTGGSSGLRTDGVVSAVRTPCPTCQPQLGPSWARGLPLWEIPALSRRAALGQDREQGQLAEVSQGCPHPHPSHGETPLPYFCQAVAALNCQALNCHSRSVPGPNGAERWQWVSPPPGLSTRLGSWGQQSALPGQLCTFCCEHAL